MAKLIVIATSLSFEICTFYSLSWTNCISCQNYRMTYQSRSKFGIELHKTTTNKVTERNYVIKVHNGSKASKFVMNELLLCIIRTVN